MNIVQVGSKMKWKYLTLSWPWSRLTLEARWSWSEENGQSRWNVAPPHAAADNAGENREAALGKH